jgi:hypothetical protein
MGMDGLFFGRLDYREKTERFNNQASPLKKFLSVTDAPD